MARSMLEASKNKRKRKSRVPATATAGPYSSSPTSLLKGSTMDFDGPFRDNVRRFLEECALRQEHAVDGNPTWRVGGSGPFLFPLYSIEEDVKACSRPFCDGCRCVGWSHHFVSKRRYHLIIPREGEWTKPMNKGILELETHLLHGMIHCNGFGHLLCINGDEEGSNSIRAEDLMDLWDQICTILRVRKITVHDISRKGSMDLRLFYGVAYGCSWYAKWGYKFNRGGFGITEDKYKRAIEVISSLELDSVIKDFADTSQGRVIRQVILKYKNASASPLVTISDLFTFMLAFKHKIPVQKKAAIGERGVMCSESIMAGEDPQSLQLNVVDDTVYVSCSGISKSNEMKSPIEENSAEYSSPSITALPVAELYSRWPTKRLEHAAKVIVNTLKEHKSDVKGQMSMSRQELRDAVRLYIGDTGLIDFVIKNIDNTIVGNQIVRRKMNPQTRTLEFTVQETVKREKLGDRDSLDSRSAALEQKFDIFEDVLCLYEYILFGYCGSHPVSMAAQVIMDSKHFVKEWKWENTRDGLRRIMCKVLPSYTELVCKLTRPLPPSELVVVPQSATADELKLAVQRALRDTYVIMDHFVVSEVKVRKMEVWDDDGGDDHYQEMEVFVRGSGLDLESELKYEGGTDNWMVDCVCGARDDDGERMVVCDLCQVRHHTLCASIDDDEDVPSMFICGKCTAMNHKRN